MWVWTPKIDMATRPFLGLSDMQQGGEKDRDKGQGTFLKLTWRYEDLNSTGQHCHFL